MYEKNKIYTLIPRIMSVNFQPSLALLHFITQTIIGIFLNKQGQLNFLIDNLNYN